MEKSIFELWIEDYHETREKKGIQKNGKRRNWCAKFECVLVSPIETFVNIWEGGKKIAREKWENNLSMFLW